VGLSRELGTKRSKRQCPDDACRTLEIHLLSAKASAVGRCALGDVVNDRKALEPGPQIRVPQGSPDSVDDALRRPICLPRTRAVSQRGEEMAHRGVVEPLLPRLADLLRQGEGAAQPVLAVDCEIDVIAARLQTIHQLFGRLRVVLDHKYVTRMA